MSAATSSRWTVTLDLEHETLKLSSEDEALRIARAAETGTLSAPGEFGDCIEVQFDAAHAMVLYMAAGGPILRPHFPNRKETGHGVEEFFCECCGVQLGPRAEMLRCCMGREEAFRLCREIFRGLLPDAIPEASEPPPWLPGMGEFAKAEEEARTVQWVPLQRRRKTHNVGERGASAP